MDNGRSAMLRSENRAALYCLRCGACLNVCPIYQKLAGTPMAGSIQAPLVRY
jgi:L-lactate dehydrogenase complex protein LldF